MQLTFSKVMQVSMLIVALLGAVIDISQNHSDSSKNDIDVINNGENSGVMAGQINIGKQSRQLDSVTAQNLDNQLRDMNAKGVTLFIERDEETYNYGLQIGAYLESKGWTFGEGGMTINAQPVRGILVSPKLDDKGFAKINVGYSE